MRMVRMAYFYVTLFGICSFCYKSGDKRCQICPEWTGIGKEFEASILLDSMINPSSAIAFGFESIRIDTKDGKRVSGFVISDSDPLILKEMAGNQHGFDLKNIKKRRNKKTSIMSSVKNLGLSAQDVVDLVEYLKKN